MNQARTFETKTGLKPLEACKILGISYSVWKDLKSERRPLRPYHLASIEAHQSLSKAQFNKLKAKRLKK